MVLSKLQNPTSGLSRFSSPPGPFTGELSHPLPQAYLSLHSPLLSLRISYDASAHIAEETKGAAKTASRGMYTSVASAFVFSFAMLMVLLFSIQDLPDPENPGSYIPGSGLDSIVAYEYPQPVSLLSFSFFFLLHLVRTLKSSFFFSQPQIMTLFVSVLGDTGAIIFAILLFLVGYNCSVACA